jgi:hypothetical protein
MKLNQVGLAQHCLTFFQPTNVASPYTIKGRQTGRKKRGLLHTHTQRHHHILELTGCERRTLVKNPTRIHHSQGVGCLASKWPEPG